MTATKIGSSLCSSNNEPPTDLLYMTYEGNFWTECDSHIVQVVVPPLTETTTAAITTNATTVTANHMNRVCLVLDRTVMHAQGGGQPTDIGQLRVQQQHRILLPPISISDSDHHYHTSKDHHIDGTNVPNERDLYDANTTTATSTTTTTTIIIDIIKCDDLQFAFIDIV